MQVVKPIITFISLIPREGKSQMDSAQHMQVSSKLCDKWEEKSYDNPEGVSGQNTDQQCRIPL